MPVSRRFLTGLLSSIDDRIDISFVSFNIQSCKIEPEFFKASEVIWIWDGSIGKALKGGAWHSLI